MRSLMFLLVLLCGCSSSTTKKIEEDDSASHIREASSIEEKDGRRMRVVSRQKIQTRFDNNYEVLIVLEDKETGNEVLLYVGYNHHCTMTNLARNRLER